jgi:hypothetical protein
LEDDVLQTSVGVANPSLSVFGLKASEVGEEEGREVKWGCYVFVEEWSDLVRRVVTLRAWGFEGEDRRRQASGSKGMRWGI